MANVVAIIGVVLSMMTIAGSAVAYVIRVYSDARRRRRNQFFELMQKLDERGTIASKLAATYQLREFPEHREFIIRFCTSQQENTTGDGSQLLIGEFKRTVAFLTQ